MFTTKSFSNVRIKDADQGTVEAVIATLDVVDKDGDVTVKGAIADGTEVVISAYGHGSWKGALPVGKGVLRTTDTEVILDGQFFLNTTHGRDTFETVKALSESGLQEWSYSLHDVKAHKAMRDGRQVQVLESIAVKEASPVLRGAGVNTRTLAVKADDDEPGEKQLASSLSRLLSRAGRDRWSSGYSIWTYLEDYDADAGYAVYGIEGPGNASRLVQVDFTRTDTAVVLGDVETEVHETSVFLPKADRKFSEHASAVLADVRALTARASGVVALRAEKGKPMSPASLDVLKGVEGELAALKALIDEPAPTQDPTPDDEATEALDRLWLTSLATSQGAAA